MGLGVAPAADQVGERRGQHPRGWRPLQPSGAGWRVTPEVGVDGRATDAQLANTGVSGTPAPGVHRLIDGDPVDVPGRPVWCPPAAPQAGALAPASVHGHDGRGPSAGVSAIAVPTAAAWSAGRRSISKASKAWRRF